MYQTILTIDGMACSMCEAHVSDTLRQNLPVKKVSASCKKGTAEFLSEEPVAEDDLHRVLDPTGYRVLEVKVAPYEKKKGLFGR